MIREPLALVTVIVAIAALSLWLAASFRWAARASATLLVIVFGAVLSNLGLVAARSPVYDFLAGPATSLAIAWLLLAVDLRDLRAAGPRMLAAFGLAVTATVAGALTAAAVFHDRLPEGWKLAGVMTGTYSGGGLNFVSVGRALELPPALFSAATAADNVMTTIWVGATLVLPVWLGRFYPAPPPRPEERESRSVHHRFATLDLDLKELAVIAVLGLGLVLAAERTAAHLPGPTIVWLTTFALVAGHLPKIRDLEGSLPLGTFTLLLFFAVLGIASRFSEVLAVGIEIFYFTALIVLAHGLLVYLFARLARLDVETTSIASQAAVGGPPTAMALALARRRPDLTLPGAAVGLLGYAVGTYVGLAVAAFVRGWG